MRNIASSVKWPYVEAGVFAALYQRLVCWWRELPLGWRSPIWPGVAAGVTILGLLLAFHQVVLGAVERAELQRRESAKYGEASWRCNNLPGQQARQSCLLDLNSQALGKPARNTSVVAAGRQIEIP